MNKKILLIDDNFHSEIKGAPLFNMEVEYLSKKGFQVFLEAMQFGKV